VNICSSFWFTPVRPTEAFALSGCEIVVVRGERRRSIDCECAALLERICNLGKELLEPPASLSPKAMTHNSQVLFDQLQEGVDVPLMMRRLCLKVATWYQENISTGRALLEGLTPYDYTFFIGNGHTPVRAHSSVLGNYPYWGRRFQSGMADAHRYREIVVEEWSLDVFGMLMRYLYGGSLINPLLSDQVSTSNLEQLALLAEYYCLTELSEGVREWIDYIRGRKLLQQATNQLETHPLHTLLVSKIRGLSKPNFSQPLTERKCWTVRGEEAPYFDTHVRGIPANRLALIQRSELLGRGEESFKVSDEFMRVWIDFVHLSRCEPFARVLSPDEYYQRLYEQTCQEVVHAYPLMQREGLFEEYTSILDALFCKRAPAGAALPWLKRWDVGAVELPREMLERVDSITFTQLSEVDLPSLPSVRAVRLEGLKLGSKSLQKLLAKFSNVETLVVNDVPHFGWEHMRDVADLRVSGACALDEISLSELLKFPYLRRLSLPPERTEFLMRYFSEGISRQSLVEFLTTLNLYRSRLIVLDLAGGEWPSELSLTAFGMPRSFKLKLPGKEVVCAVGRI
jgi:hypothetical protein